MKDLITTTIEVTDSHIKLLQAKQARVGKVISYCDLQKITVYTDKEIAKLLETMISTRNIKSPGLVGVIPRRFAILKHLLLPSHSPEEIRRMVDLQVVNDVPYAKGDIIFDYIPLEQEESGHTKILVIIIHREVIGRYLALFHEAGLYPKCLTLSSIGLCEWLIFQDQKVKNHSLLPSVLIYMDQNNSEICFCSNKKLLFSRNINYGIKDLNPESVLSFVKQFYLTMGTYKKEVMGPEILRIVLVSTASSISLVQERIEKEFDLPIEILRPSDHLPCDKDLDLSVMCGETGLCALPGVGLLFSEMGKLPNFIPEELKTTETIKQKTKTGIQLVVLVLFTFLLAVAAFGIDVYKNSLYLNRLRKEVSQTKVRAQKAEDQIRKFNFIAQQMQHRTLMTDLFYELYDLTPKEIAFRLIDIDKKGYVVIHGFSQDGTALNRFQNVLVNSSLLTDVRLQYSTKIKIFNQEMIDFKILCQLSERKSQQ